MDPRRQKKVAIRDPRAKPTANQINEENVKELSTEEMVVNLLNEASLASSDPDKLEKLRKVQELMIKKQPDLLDSFSDEVVAFQTDSSPEIRKFVIGFMEESCKVDAELFSKFLLNFYMLLVDESVTVLKRVIQSTTQLYRALLQWITTSKKSEEILQTSWKILCDVQTSILNMLDSENDGVRTQSVKFAEKIIVTLSEKHRFSELPKKPESFSSLDELQVNHPFVKKSELKQVGEGALEHLLKFVASPAISSINLMASMGTLTTIAKQRPQYMGEVVQAFEALHANLPPTLAKTQVTSVRKNLKLQLLNLLRHTSSVEFHPQITTLLYGLGTNQLEIARNMPKLSATAKDKKASWRKRSPEEDQPTSGKSRKRPRVELKDESDDDDDDDDMVVDKNVSANKLAHSSAVDITADELVPLLTPENVANLVLLSMVMLPEKIPDAFQASYTPIESAGTMEQIIHLARLLSVQMTAVGIGSGIQLAAEMQAEEEAKKREEEERKEQKVVPIQTVIGGTTEEKKEEQKPDKKVSMEVVAPAMPGRSLQRRIQGFHLASITKPLSLDVKDRIIKMAVLRVLKAERSAVAGGVHHQWQKILTSLVAQFGGDLHRSLAKFILTDIRNRSQLAFQWLYEEFNIYLENSRGPNDRAAQENYDACLTSLLQGLLDKQDSREGLFAKLAMQAPLLTDAAIKIIRAYCEDARKSHAGMVLLQDLLSRRPNKRLQFLRVLLELSSCNSEKVRRQAIVISRRLYNSQDFHDLIEQYATAHLSLLKQDEPSKDLFTKGNGENKWSDVMMKQCMDLFLSLLPDNHQLIHKLAEVYVGAAADIKRVVLRALEVPVLGMGMTSSELLYLVETCPKGAETLVTRMLHILTDKEHPSPELVCRVRDLYQKRVPDVRFLIPVLNGLEKHEVLLALPKLVKLNPPVVKGVFNRLLGVQRDEGLERSSSALSPVELLVALHNIDQSKADVKSIIKATSLCFAEKSVYTSEVLVTVINQLVEQEVIPTLLMRTVIQALISYPRLSGFVMNVLQRLIVKRVWEQTKVWEGFIRCCQRMKPQSFQVLLQLPPAQLSNVFESVPDLREPLLQYVNKFTPQQRQHISPAIISVMELSPEQRQAEMQAAAAQHALEEMRAKEREEQVRVAQEWECQERMQREKQDAESARLEMEQNEVMERRVQEEKERAISLAHFRAVKDEPKIDGAGGFPASVDLAETNISDVTDISTSAPPSVTQDVKPVITPKPQSSTATADALATPRLPSVPSSVQQLLLPPDMQLPPPNMLIPPPGVTLAMPPHLLHRVPLSVEVKAEKRSPTPTQDERTDGAN